MKNNEWISISSGLKPEEEEDIKNGKEYYFRNEHKEW